MTYSSIPPSNGKVALVTGLNGYIGSWVGLAMLNDGYTLRGSVRRKASADPVLSSPLFKSYVDAGRVEVVEVPDITIPGAFDEAVKGVDNIQHVAAPAAFNLKTVKDYVDPAVNSILSILKSAQEHATNLRVFTFTSSVAACAEITVPKIYTPADWNDTLPDTIEEQGDSAPPFTMYRYSKWKAERAFWEFEKTNKPSFAMSTVLPAYVYGPMAFLPSSPDGLSQSVKAAWALWTGGPTSTFTPGCIIDVRDIARIHAWTAKCPAEAHGQRLVMSAWFCPTQGVADIWRSAEGGKWKSRIQEGEPGKGYIDGTFPYISNGFDSSLPLEKILAFTPLKKTLIDMAHDFERLG